VDAETQRSNNRESQRLNIFGPFTKDDQEGRGLTIEHQQISLYLVGKI